MRKIFALFVLIAIVLSLVFVLFYLSQKQTNLRETIEKQDSISHLNGGYKPEVASVTVSDDSTDDLQQNYPVNSFVQKKSNLELPKEKVEEDLNQTSNKAVSHVIRMLTGKLSGADISDFNAVSAMAIVRDSNSPLRERRGAAWHLARSANRSELEELRKIFFEPNTPSSVKTAIIEGIGYCQEPEKLDFILLVLQDEEDSVVRAAIRGLSAIGDERSIDILADIVNASAELDNVAAQAVSSLAQIDNSKAFDTLVGMYNNPRFKDDNGYKEQIISALGQRDISETIEFFRKIYQDENSDSSIKATVVEAVGESSGDTTTFLLEAMQNPDSQVRANAAWAFAEADDIGNISPQLKNMLQKEQDPYVRKNLYLALGNQSNCTADDIISIVAKEPDIEAKLAGYDLLAKNLENAKSSALGQFIDNIAVPELKYVALNSNHLNQKLNAIITLKRIDSEASKKALAETATTSTDYRVVKAIGTKQ